MRSLHIDREKVPIGKNLVKQSSDLVKQLS